MKDSILSYSVRNCKSVRSLLSDKSRGFTLIEIIAVFVLMAILTTVAVSVYSTNTFSAQSVAEND